MLSAADEAARLKVLADFGVMDSGPDETLDEVVALASSVCATPIALISLVDASRRWFKARVGLGPQETPREHAFCSHVICEQGNDVFTVPDSRRDPRFAKDSLVAEEPKAVFYAGAPLVADGGAKLGTLCVMAREPRELTASQGRALKTLSKVVVHHLERARALAQSRVTEARLEAVLASIGDAVLVTDGAGHVRSMNPGAEALSGVASRDAIGVPIVDILTVLDGATRSRGESLVTRVLAEGRPETREHSILVRRDRRVVAVDETATPVSDPRGTVRGAVLVLRDITEATRSDAERAKLLLDAEGLLAGRQVAERDLERMFTLSADILSTSRDGYFTKVSPAFEKILGWTMAELRTFPIGDLLHPDDAERAARQRDATASGASVRGHEARYRHKDGTYRWIAWSAAAEGGTVYSVGRDITDEKAIHDERLRLGEEQRIAREAAEQANRTMDDFLATVSHELRTPLNAMLGWTRLLRNGQLPEAQRAKALATIERNASIQAQLIGDILDVSRIISGKMRIDLEPVDLDRVIHAAVDVIRPIADAKNIRLDVRLDPSASRVTGDDTRLQQVVWNLLSNAVKFTPKGGHVELSVADANGWAEVTVKDNGSGVAPEFLGHVFERFRQEDGAITRSHGGLGLGLAIVKNIIELHGGTVRVESPGVGLGASFVIGLPLSAASPRTGEATLAERVSSAPSRPQLAGLEILVVDDEPDARELLAELLARYGAVVRSVGSVQEALAALAEEPFDLVISDVGMPVEDGYALVKRVRARPAKEGRIPVIALTSFARPEDRTRALRAGFDMHVAKPIEPAELLAVVASVAARASES